MHYFRYFLILVIEPDVPGQCESKETKFHISAVPMLSCGSASCCIVLKHSSPHIIFVKELDFKHAGGTIPDAG